MVLQTPANLMVCSVPGQIRLSYNDNLATDEISIGFSECGTVQSETTKNNTRLTTFIHHHVVTAVSVISLMSTIEVDCVLRQV